MQMFDLIAEHNAAIALLSQAIAERDKFKAALEEVGKKEWVQGSSVKLICTNALADGCAEGEKNG